MITCRDVTDWLLEAELSELQTPHDRAMAEHVAACSSCATRAARILGDTAALALAVSPPLARAMRRIGSVRRSAPTRGRWLYPAYVATGLLAASLLLVLLTRAPRTESRRSSGVHGVDVASTSTRRATSEPKESDEPSTSKDESPPPAAHRSTPPSTTGRLSLARAVAPVAIAPESVPAIPARAVRLDTLYTSGSVRVDARPSLAVDVVPSAGRYAVLGSTPRVTVVWFY